MRSEPPAEDELQFEPNYYYVDGEPIELHPSDQVAVDVDAAVDVEVPQWFADELQNRGRPLRGSVVMLPMADLPPELDRTLDDAGALHPVYVAPDETLLAVLPEVRVVAANQDEVRQVKDYLDTSELEAELVGEKGEQLTIRPSSGRGADALDIANTIEEKIHPLATQARFLRIVAKPDVSEPTQVSPELPPGTTKRAPNRGRRKSFPL